MKLRLLLLLAAIALIIPSLRAATFTFEHEGNTLIYEVIDESAKTCRLVSWNADWITNCNLIIPGIANGYYVTEIGNGAFKYSNWMTSLIIPNTVTTIGEEAFTDASLGPLTIPNSVTTIGDMAFRACGITSLTLSNSLSVIGNLAFWGNSGLSTVEIPSSVTVIGGGAFLSCTGLTSVTIPNSVTTIGGQAFMDCSNLTSIYIPESVTQIGYIGGGTFEGCSGLTKAEFASIESLCSIDFWDETSNPLYLANHLYINGEEITDIVIPNTVSTIRMYSLCGSSITSIEIPNSVTSLALTGCTGLTSIEIPNSVTSLSLKGCTGLTSIDIPNSVKELGPFSFSDCKGITSVRIPNSVIGIYDWAFKGCEKLETIIMGQGIEGIMGEAFAECPVSNIFITAPTPPKLASNAFDDYSGTLHLQGQASAEAYAADEVWGQFKRELMVEASELTIEGESYISGKAGETFQLKATIAPADVTLPYIYWRSTNSRIATVDNNGLVTLLEDTESEEDQTRSYEADDANNSCNIIAESLYFDGPIAEVTVYNSDFNGVETVIDKIESDFIDYSQPYLVYNMSGAKVGDSKEKLAKGIYIVRQGKAAVKISVK